MIRRGGVYWADLGPASGSRPAKRRPVVVVQSDGYNESRLHTTIAVALTSNTALASLPGNVFVPAKVSRLPKDSVANLTALVTLNKSELEGPVGVVTDDLVAELESGLRMVLGL